MLIDNQITPSSIGHIAGEPTMADDYTPAEEAKWSKVQVVHDDITCKYSALAGLEGAVTKQQQATQTAKVYDEDGNPVDGPLHGCRFPRFVLAKDADRETIDQAIDIIVNAEENEAVGNAEAVKVLNAGFGPRERNAAVQAMRVGLPPSPKKAAENQVLDTLNSLTGGDMVAAQLLLDKLVAAKDTGEAAE